MALMKFYHVLRTLIIVFFLTAVIYAQSDDDEMKLTFSADVTPVSKYIWRGQRLTDGWSLQPSGTLGIGGFSFNFWGNVDLVAVNEGDALPIQENPEAPPGNHKGLQGKFSEIDYTLSYDKSLGNVSLGLGTIFYTYPDRSASLATTAEVYGTVGFSNVLLSPTFSLFVDVDESRKAGSTGVYFAVSGSHLFLMDHSKFKGLELSSSLGIVNSGNGNFYYGISKAGFHDFAFTTQALFVFGEHWSFTPFMTYSALLGEFRDHQFLNPRLVYLGTVGSPATAADTIWGGATLSLQF